MRVLNSLMWFLIVPTSIFAQSSGAEYSVDEHIHTFYYNWYGNPETDGEFKHWKHDILPHWSDTSWNHAGGFPGGDEIGANYYPSLGCYSSNDPKIVAQHMNWIQEAGIGVVVITWWGKDSYEDRSLGLFLDEAEKAGVKIAIHLEPFYKSMEEARDQIVYVSERYGKHPALYRYHGSPLWYVYDSYRFSAAEWARLLSKEGDLSLRDTDADALFIGLWVQENEQDFFKHSGFNGFYTYFASEGFVYGSTTANWKTLAAFAQDSRLLFIPCVGPGYIDTRIRPWNEQNTEARLDGEYFEWMYREAAKVSPDFIGITSFNEWHEGTQIEPAVSKQVAEYRYEDYGAKDPEFYLRLTRQLIEKYRRF